MMDTVESTPTRRCPSCHTKLRVDARFCGNCGARLPHDTDVEAASLVGSVVAGAYRIDGVLGTGSMGVVYRAEQIALRRQVALKVIGESADDDTTRARFRREARAASQLNHPNVVQVYDFGQLPGGQPYLAMELLQGQTLEQLIEKEFPLAIERVATIMVDILNALQAAHNLGILHRDLKPANVFVSQSPEGRSTAKVLDFGIATAMDGSLTGSQTWAPLTEAGFVCGTPAFMSPEQVQGFALDQRSDLFSAAGLMYQMLTRERPFRGKSPVEVGANIVLKPLVPPSRARPDLDIPPVLDEFLTKGMSKKAEDRFATAVDMIEGLEDIVARLSGGVLERSAPVAVVKPVPATSEWPEVSFDDPEESNDTVVNQESVPRTRVAPPPPVPTIRERQKVPQVSLPQWPGLLSTPGRSVPAARQSGRMSAVTPSSGQSSRPRPTPPPVPMRAPSAAPPVTPEPIHSSPSSEMQALLARSKETALPPPEREPAPAGTASLSGSYPGSAGRSESSSWLTWLLFLLLVAGLAAAILKLMDG